MDRESFALVLGATLPGHWGAASSAAAWRCFCDHLVPRRMFHAGSERRKVAIGCFRCAVECCGKACTHLLNVENSRNICGGEIVLP